MRDASIKKILLLGSGPITIGQASEFDYSGTQALRALKAEGYEVVLANSNPATIMTDPEFSDRIYIEPLTPEFLEKIIEIEKPDAILPTMGGQTALNLAVALAESGVLAKYGVRMLGANLESIKKAEDRELFKKIMLELGLDVPKSKVVRSIEEMKDCLDEIGLPMILRPSFTLGGEGGGVVHTEDEFKRLLERGLFLSPTRSVLVEESLIGWKEYELEVVRDRKDNVVIICSIENLDPMGIHTGDSITVAPAQTLTDRQYQSLRNMSKQIIRAIGVETGGSNIQFAVKPNGPDAGRTIVIEMNPRVSRSSALASKATGFPIAKIAAKLAVGYTLEEITNEITGTTPASFEPSIDYVVVKIPRFDFEKFQASPPTLGTQMKSVGETMAMGRTFREAFLKALSGMEHSRNWLKPTEFDDQPSKPASELEEILRKPVWTKIWYVASALRRGVSVATIADWTGIDPWFLAQIQELVELEMYFKKQKTPIAKWSDDELIAAKKSGYLDRDIARWTGETEKTVAANRESRGIRPRFDLVDTCAGEFESKTPYFYSTYWGSESKGNSTVAELATSRDSNVKPCVMILGGGPNRIGQGIEFDYCCVHASFAAQDLGFQSVMVNCNPETVSTDYDVSSKLFFEPVTAEHVTSVARYLESQGLEVKGAIVQFGGQTPLKIARAIEEAGIPILGTSVESIDIAEDRERFDAVMSELASLGLRQPQSATATNSAEAVKLANKMGYPVLIRPSYVLGGRGMRVVFSEESFRQYIDEAIEVSDSKPVLIDRYLSDAVEVDVDALCDGKDCIVAGIMEHIEEAGIHSGDSACSLPAFTLGTEILERLREYARILAKRLKVVGLINIQFAVQGKEIYVLEVNPRASRTVPFVAKAVGKPIARLGAKLMMGKTLAELGLTSDLDLNLSRFNVKMPVFPFHKFPNVDVVLGPEMKSTGEVMGRAKEFNHAYAKALLGAGVKLPDNGRVFISVAESDKPEAAELAERLLRLGFSIDATGGTHAYFTERKIPSELVSKVSQGVPNCVTHIASGRYALVVNTTYDEKSLKDSYSIRRTALEKKVPYCTLITTARAFLRAIESSRDHKLQAEAL